METAKSTDVTNVPTQQMFEVIRSVQFSHSQHQKFYTYQQDAYLTDFTLNVQGAQIQCHKVVLSTSCPYFEALLRSGLKEVENSQVNLDFNKDMMDHLIKYFYTGELKLPNDEIKELVRACEYLQLAVLKHRVEKYLVTQLDDNNCIGWMDFATSYSMNSLASKATNLMLNNFTSVSKQKEFLDLSLTQLLEFIRKKKMHVHSEAAILDACIVWVKSGLKHRKKYFNELLGKVTLKNCSAKYLAKVSSEHNDLFQNKDSQQKLFTAFKDMAMSSENNSFETDDREQECIFLCGGFVSKKKANNKMHLFADGEWKKMCSILPIDTTILTMNACLANGELIVTTGETFAKNCFSFNFNTSSWIELPWMPMGRDGYTSQYIAGSVYVFGGRCISHGLCQRLEVLDLETKTWNTKENMIHGVSLPIAVETDSSIYMVQNTCSENTPTVEQHGITMQIYNAENDQWKYGAPLTNLVSTTRGACAVVHKANILLVGGEHMISASYSIKSDTWTIFIKQCKLPRVHLYGSAVIKDGRVRILGGCSNLRKPTDSQDNHVSEIPIGGRAWKEIFETLPIRLAHHMAVKVPLCYLMK